MTRQTIVSSYDSCEKSVDELNEIARQQMHKPEKRCLNPVIYHSSQFLGRAFTFTGAPTDPEESDLSMDYSSVHMDRGTGMTLEPSIILFNQTDGCYL